MKKRFLQFVSIFVIAFLLGGMVVAQNNGLSVSEALWGDSRSQTAQAAKDLVIPSLPAVNGDITSMADIVEQAAAAIVNVEAKIKVANTMINNPFLNDPFFRQFFQDNFYEQPQSTYETGIGSGFIISTDGYILTNQHVVENAESVTVQLSNKKDPVPAVVVGQDSDLDLALLKIDGVGYPTLTLGDSDKARVGEWVVAIGQPYGLDHTVTAGVISAKGRPITIGNRNYRNLIQIDAAINPGNSGGPLLNMNGEVVAINTAVNVQAQGIGFAIPINTASEVLQQLKTGDKIVRSYMGIRMGDVNNEIRDYLNLDSSVEGVFISEIISGSPAAKAGLQANDIIQKIDNIVIDSTGAIQDYVEKSKVGSKILVDVLRNGRPVQITVILEAKP